VRLIECVPNVSEGRRPEVVAAIAAAISGVAGVRLLDQSSDVAHNRSVFTFAGEEGPVGRAALAVFETAVPAIDLRTHRGAHPRLGAVDVVPFIPLDGAPMSACVTLARQTAATVWERLQIPVYLYEEAASRDARRNLADVRRGEFEGLAEKMATAEWAPDYGSPRPHPTAGATAIGARAALVAFNVNLATSDLSVAKAIAATVRESSGGLPFIKALGVTLDHRGIVQVSMNLTNFQKMPLVRVFEAVLGEAERRGTSVLESEIVGLVPEAALPPDPAHTLRLADFSSDQVLERRLRGKVKK
jgi:glutamate formiminotransferase